MNWKNTRLIFRRELSDQWRDRRTIFTILVMPLVLYPLMGMALLQTAQFLHQAPPKVLVIGADQIADPSELFKENGFQPDLLGQGKNNDSAPILLFDRELPKETKASLQLAVRSFDQSAIGNRHLKTELKRLNADLLLLVGKNPTASNEVNLRLFANSTSDQSALAVSKVTQILDQWKAKRLNQRLDELNLSTDSVSALNVATVDLASQVKRKAAMWAKLLPFIVLVWALTGAFYPAIDVCAGEKERGTLETLLSSPARRSEIVVGKLLTVASFSFSTAMLNLISMTATGLLVIGQLSGQGNAPMNLGLPPLTSLPWLVVGLLPIVALFSSLALALASFAKSSKEGQYYLVPMLMSLVPLMMLAMLPSAKLDLGTSLIPVTGMLLLIKNLMLSDYATALQFCGPVIAITLVCCWMSTRWAIHQFNNESVLFRSGEKFGVAVWLRHLVRDRGPMPSFGEAILCGVIILLIKFFIGLTAQLELTFSGFAKQVVISQFATIALPAILMALFLTRGPRETLKLNRPRLSYVSAAVLIAILLHPGFLALSHLVMYLYPASQGLSEIQHAVAAIFADAPNTLAIIAVIAFVPAICEEIAFRGFILSGLQSLGRKWTAIFISAALFGIAHGILQQSIMASFVGIVLGVISVQTRSLFPCVGYHAMHNSLPVLMGIFPSHSLESSYMGYVLKTGVEGGVEYTMLATILMPIMGIGLLVWLWNFSEGQQSSTKYWSLPKPATA